MQKEGGVGEQRQGCRRRKIFKRGLARNNAGRGTQRFLTECRPVVWMASVKTNGVPFPNSSALIRVSGSFCYDFFFGTCGVPTPSGAACGRLSHNTEEIAQLHEKGVAGSGEIGSRGVELVEGVAVADEHHGARRRTIGEEPVGAQRVGVRRMRRSKASV